MSAVEYPPDLVRALIERCFPLESAHPKSAYAPADELLRCALDHGVAPLLWVRAKGLDLPDPFRTRLRGLYAANLLRNERLKAEQDAALAALHSAGIDAWPLKGPHLSETLYADLGVRQSADLDLLVRPGSLAPADKALSDLGYSRLTPGALDRLRKSPELLYRRTTAGEELYLDLQLRLVPGSGPDPLAARIHAAGLTSENLLLLLCVNHLVHRFSRLKYIADLAQCLRRFSGAMRWDEVCAAVRELDCAPGVFLSLRMTHDVARAPVPDFVLARLKPAGLDRWMASRALDSNVAALLGNPAALDGPAGAWIALASLRGVGPRLRQLRSMLFPTEAYLRERYGSGQPLWKLHLRRWRRRIPPAVKTSPV